MHSLASARLASLVLAALLTTLVQAQVNPAKSYPERPIHIVVGFAAGGGTDIIARTVGEMLSELLNQPVVVDNKLGAAGIIASEYVARANPDGYTLFMAPSGVMVANPVIYKKLPYSPTRDFIPISMAITYPLFLVVNSSEPIQSMKELVGYIKSNPGKANYGGSSGLFQLYLELFKLRTGTQVEFIPYKGGNSEAMRNVMAGNILMTISDATTAIGAIKSGKVRSLAVTSPRRVPYFPDIPTMAEAGFPEMGFISWMGFFAPAKTPMVIVRKLQDEINRILKLPEFRKRMNALQVDPAGNTSEEFARVIASEIALWSDVAKAGNIAPIN